MLRGFVIASSVAALALPVLAAGDAPVVPVTGGRIQGRLLPAPGGAVFKGIPFAAPPSGELRWREPGAVRPWTGIRDAGEYGAPCAQVAGGWNDKVAAIGKEDCLFLNVWTPEWPAGPRKPVMVWIHGGANMGGSAMGAAGIEPPFDGARLARRGVVVVTINYRVGLLGFMAHPELTAESPHRASGNYGLLDQVAALRWVRENAAAFGGDPGNVTVFGQSAGAHDIGLLMVSPLARGLFHRAIAQSGTVVIGGRLTPALAQAEESGVKLAGQMGAPAAGALKHLRALSAADVIRASPPYASRGPLRPEPNVDGYVLTRPPVDVFRSGGQAPVPLIIGNNGRERALEGGPDALRKAIAEFYGPLAPKAEALYADPPAYPPHGQAGAQFSTDTMFRCGAVLVAGWHAARFPAYQYEFTRGYEPAGAVHSWELQYVFGNLGGNAAEPEDRRLSDQVQEYWVNFARTGDPNGGALPAWPRLDGGQGYLEFAAGGPVAKTGLRGAFCALFREKIDGQARRPVK
jgi:para-nitrobenzyl esterase